LTAEPLLGAKPATVAGPAERRDYAPYLERAFAEEPVEGPLPIVAIEGELPPGLRGTYLLNGPGRFAAGEVRYRNWLDGDGMLLAVRFGEAGPQARLGFVATTKLREERTTGTAIYRTFGTRFAGDRLSAGVTVASPVNLSAYPFGGRLLAFGEQGQPWEVDPVDLGTLGPASFGGAVTAATPFSGHPKLDPHSGELVTFGVSFLPQAPTLHFFRFAADGELALRARTPLPWPASIHDFALAERHAVFHVAPHLLDLAALRAGATVREALSWQPRLGSRLLVLDRDSGTRVAEVPVGERYCLHLLNAWEDGPRLVVDLLELDRPVYDDYDGLPDLFVRSPAGRAVRYEIDVAGGALAGRTSTQELGTVDFPTFDRRHATRRADRGWALALAASGAPGRKFFDRLYEIRWGSGRVAATWEAPRGTYLAGEPAFAPLADGTAGDNEAGVLLVPLWDAGANRSALALFDVEGLAAGPRATVWMGRRAPLGFHSFWQASSES
jgi:carotenoid cleavage dioxygenase-like enzyme